MTERGSGRGALPKVGAWAVGVGAAAALVALVLATRADGEVQGYRDEDLAVARQLRDDAMEGTRAFEIAEDLTTRVGPRLAGSPGDARAVEWATERLGAMGFDDVRRMPVTFPTWRRGEEVAEVVSPAPQPLVVTTLGYAPPTPEGGVEAEIVEFADLEALEGAAREDVEGKIPFVNHRMERSRDGSTYPPAVAARTRGPAVAREKGAAAFLLRSVGTGEHRFAHTGMTAFDFEAYREDPGGFDPAADAPAAPAAALAHPDADQLERLIALGEAVKVRLELGASYGDPYTSHNVIADIRGEDEPDEYVLISAHLDSWDLSPGAQDDAAGVAIVMETARRILERDERPRRTIRLVLFAAEEIGLLGAQAYADAHARAVDRHHVGSESDFGAGEVYEFSARVRDDAWPLARAIGAELAPLGIEMGERDAFGGPDMQPMRARGMAVVDLQQDGTRYFDYHHTKDDTLDTIDPAALDQNVAAWLVFSWLAAQAPAPFGSGADLAPGGP